MFELVFGILAIHLSSIAREMILSGLFVVFFIDQILMKESLTCTLNNKKVKTFSRLGTLELP